MLNRFIKSFSWELIGAVFLFGYQLFAAKFLGAFEYGKANYYLGFISTIMIIMGFGIQYYFPKQLILSKEKEKLLGQIFGTVSILFIIFSIPIILYLKSKLELEWSNIIIVLISSYFGVLLIIVRAYYIGLIRAERASFLCGFMFRIINIIFFILIILFFKKDYQTFLLSMLLAYIAVIVPFFSVKLKGVSFDLNMLKLIRGFYLVELTYGIYLPVSKIIQKEFGTYESLAVLSIGLVLGKATLMFGNSIAKVIIPNIVTAWERRDVYRMQLDFQYAARINTYLILPVAIGAILNSNRILDLLGKGYSGGGLILSIVLFSQFFVSFVGPNGTVLLMTGNEKHEIFNGIIKLVIALLTVLMFGQKYYWGIAFSIAVSEIVVNVLKTVEVYYVLNMVPYPKKVFIYIGLILCADLLGFYFLSFIENSLLWFVLNIIFAVTNYILIFRYSPQEDDKIFITNVLKKIIN